MDRAGANPWRVIDQIRTKLRLPAAAVQVPIGVEDELTGVVDLIRWKAVYNQGQKGYGPTFAFTLYAPSPIQSRIEVVESDVPESVITLAKQKRQELLEQLAEVDDEIGEMLIMDEEPSVAQVAEAIRRATVGLKFTPVFLGSAIKNTGVQPLLDGVCNYLPTPSESEVTAHDTSLSVSAPPVPLTPAAAAPLVALAFKLEEGRFGQLTYMRVYQGSMRKGQFIFHARTGKKVKIPRLARMHSDEMEEIGEIGPGEICAIFGVDCASGDTFTDGTTNYSMVRTLTLKVGLLADESSLQTSMFVPDPVISLALKPVGKDTPNFSRALNRFQKEDPTFRVHIDHESKEVMSLSLSVFSRSDVLQTIISGMGELHLEIYVERMRREYNVECTTGKPKVAFRETITQRAEFQYTHKKQTGGAGQYARVIGYVEPMEKDEESGKDTGFENLVMGGNIPTNYIPAVERVSDCHLLWSLADLSSRRDSMRRLKKGR